MQTYAILTGLGLGLGLGLVSSLAIHQLHIATAREP
jgi:hypothetical protein